jgi:hypothetical protein
MLILVLNIELAYTLAAFYDPRLKNPRPERMLTVLLRLLTMITPETAAVWNPRRNFLLVGM